MTWILVCLALILSLCAFWVWIVFRVHAEATAGHSEYNPWAGYQALMQRRREWLNQEPVVRDGVIYCNAIWEK